MKGKGLNSIRIRFTLIAAVSTAICTGIQLHLWMGGGYAHVTWSLIAAVMICITVIPTVIMWMATTKLTAHIRALRKSTDAIVSGDFDSPVEVDCACEVGGLADSFRRMVGRLNSNVLRMNVLAYSDTLTGLPNRIAANHMLRHMTHDTCGAVFFIDLDGFKKINDTFGHEAGDDLLRQVSRRIIEQGLHRTREQLDSCTTPFGELCERAPEDIVFARFAGDEFVALVPDEIDPHALATVAASIVSSLREPFYLSGNQVTVGASVGVVRTPIDSSDPAELLNFADIAMYAAKEVGKNGYRLFDQSMRDLVVERNAIETDLGQAIASDALALHYQPKLDTATLECLGVEALVRWNHPVREVLAILGEYDVPAALLELEITESMLLSDLGAARERIRQMQAAGITISIDDFGTGFSNLSQLSKLSVNTLKIDQSLIADIGGDDRSESIVKAIVGMAHALGHKTIAEGVERPEQLHFLQQVRCDRVQGFLLGCPMSAADLEHWYEERSKTVPCRSAREEVESEILSIFPVGTESTGQDGVVLFRTDDHESPREVVG